MPLTIDLLGDRDADAYSDFVLEAPTSLLYSSFAYRAFLRRILPESESRYLLVKHGGTIVGAFPTFVRLNARHGNVLNSLPFYGSHGGPILTPRYENPRAVASLLYRAFDDVRSELRVAASTVIEPPFPAATAEPMREAPTTLRDERIGQITPLPQDRDSEEAVRTALFDAFHYKTRNAIRKAQKSGFRIGHDGANDAMRILARLHAQNIEAVGGLAKGPEIFSAIRETFTYDRDYRVYVAEHSGTVAAVLLVFFHNRSVEYFTPATDPQFRDLQPMSLLIFEAMQEAARRRCLYWNWGGTWLSQSGVYRFKSRWGTRDFPYRYRIDVSDPGILALDKSVLLDEYRYYYVAPFSALSASPLHARADM